MSSWYFEIAHMTDRSSIIPFVGGGGGGAVAGGVGVIFVGVVVSTGGGIGGW
jgi:hypothetical protein